MSNVKPRAWSKDMLDWADYPAYHFENLHEGNFWKVDSSTEYLMWELFEYYEGLRYNFNNSYRYGDYNDEYSQYEDDDDERSPSDAYTVGELAFAGCRNIKIVSGDYLAGGSRVPMASIVLKTIAEVREYSEPYAALSWIAMWHNKYAIKSIFSDYDMMSFIKACYETGLSFDAVNAYLNSPNVSQKRGVHPAVIKNDIDDVMLESLITGFVD